MLVLIVVELVVVVVVVEKVLVGNVDSDTGINEPAASIGDVLISISKDGDDDDDERDEFKRVEVVVLSLLYFCCCCRVDVFSFCIVC